ncbi:MAG TPA: SurA N-terminal domain-containing protein [Bacteroidales bacterium]|nr:SurA N-terminal domain-containing protein [Bacteroidales bacterium]
MSTLQFLREKAGVLVAVVIGVSLFIFVVSDFFGNGRGQRLRQKEYYELGTIGDESVSYQDYEQRLQNLYEIYKLSGRDLDENTTEQVREQMWQQMVRETILDRQYSKLGIGVSTEELDELVFGNNPHMIVQQLFTDQQTGMFNKSFMVNFLKQTEVDETAKKYWLFFEDEIVNERMNSKYNTFVSKGLYVTSKQAEFDKTLSEKTVDFSYIMKNYNTIPDSSVTITESEITAYFEKNKESYKRSAVRDIEYIAFDVVPSPEDLKQTEDWINKVKEEFRTAADPVDFINLTADSRHIGFFYPIDNVSETLREFVKKEDTNSIYGPYIENDSYKLARLLAVEQRPDSVHARHILISAGTTRTLEESRKIADSLVAVIKKGSAKFEDLAKSVSDDQGSAQIGGDLGWFTEGRMVVPFNNACFSGKKGDIKTAETTFGVHIIEILAQSKTSKKYNIGYIDRKIIPGSQTNQRIYSEASQFAGTNNTYEKFNKAVAENKLNKRVANNVIPQQKTLPGLENPRYLIMSLFNAENGSIILDNNQQAVFEIGDKYVVAYCTKIQEDGYADLKDVEADVRFALLKDKKAEVISEEFRKNSGDGKSLDAVASAMGLTVQDAAQVNFRSYSVPGLGTEPALAAASSVSAQGVISGPVKGTNGVFLLTVNNSSSAQAEDIKTIQKRLASTYQMRGSYEAYEALRKGADIVDKRYKFY